MSIKKKIHFRFFRRVTQTTLIACQVGGMNMYHWSDASPDKDKVTCSNCKRTKIYKVGHDC